MTYKEYREILDYELYSIGGNKVEQSVLDKFRIKYFQPNTNCVYLARKMWYLYSLGGVHRLRSKFIYLRILRKFGCIIYPSAKVERGFHIAHPVGIVLGDCKIGSDFTIFQGCTIGTGNKAKNSQRTSPIIGKNVCMLASSTIVGGVTVVDSCVIGANSTVIRNLSESGIYVGSPAKWVKPYHTI